MLTALLEGTCLIPLPQQHTPSCSQSVDKSPTDSTGRQTPWKRNSKLPPQFQVINSQVLLSWGEFPMVFRKVNFQRVASFVLDQNCTTNLSYQPPDYWWASVTAIYWVKTIKKNNIVKLTAYFDFSLLSSLPVSRQHHSSHRRNNPTYWHHLQPSEYMATTSTSANRQNHCAQHYAAAVGTHNFKRMSTSRVSADVWNTKRPCRFDKVSLLKHILLWEKKTNRQIFIYLGYLLWWIFIYWAQQSTSLLRGM